MWRNADQKIYLYFFVIIDTIEFIGNGIMYQKIQIEVDRCKRCAKNYVGLTLMTKFFLEMWNEMLSHDIKIKR